MAPLPREPRGRPDQLRLLVLRVDLRLHLRDRRRRPRLRVLELPGKEGDFEDGPPVHGHTGLEIAWTAIPFVLVTAMAIVSAIVLAQNGARRHRTAAGHGDRRSSSPGRSRTRTGKTYPILRLPDRPARRCSTITAKDVLHSFWVPQFCAEAGCRSRARPSIVITPTKLGTFPVICTELCGLGHSVMRSTAIVMTAGRLRRLVQAARAGAAGAGGGGGDARGARRLPRQRLRRLPHLHAGRRRPGRSAPTSTT